MGDTFITVHPLYHYSVLPCRSSSCVPQCSSNESSTLQAMPHRRRWFAMTVITAARFQASSLVAHQLYSCAPGLHYIQMYQLTRTQLGGRCRDIRWGASC